MIEIRNFEKHLKSLTQKEWESLIDLLPEIESTKNFGERIEPELLDDGSYSFPYWRRSEIVNKTFDAIDLLNLTPVFDWMNWEEGRESLGNENFDFSKVDIITLCKFLTCIIRLDRFSEGHLVANFENGTIENIIKNLSFKLKEEPIIFSYSNKIDTSFKLWNLLKRK